MTAYINLLTIFEIVHMESEWTNFDVLLKELNEVTTLL